jgi:membrane associated rhomboid family serine protease
MQRRRAIVVPIIIFLNVVVYLMWLAVSGSRHATAPWSTYLPFLNLEFMYEHFLVSWTAMAEGRYWVVITSVFSHNMFWHILINMFVLRSFGTILELVLGPMLFLQFYLIAGIVSSLCHAIISAFILGTPDLPALGASGSIAGLVLVFALVFPREKILLFGVVPIPALWGAIAFIALDMFGLFEQARGSGLPIGHGAHLGGAATGIVFFFAFLRPRMRRKQALAKTEVHS